MKILVTGAAGFIGFHTGKRLIESGHSVVGIDNMNDYYDVRLKEKRIEILKESDLFEYRFMDLCDRREVSELFDGISFERVIHLAAQAGVRYSLENPEAYIDSNVIGFHNVLEGCRKQSVAHLVYASSSSVYGANTRIPFAVTDNVDHPVSLYGATKRANELMAHSYSYLFGLPTTGLRLFTVYGPWGRPDMAYFLFTKAILEGDNIDLFNHGDMRRDFTYIDDVIEVIIRVMDIIPFGEEKRDRNVMPPNVSSAPFRIYNVGRHETVSLMDFLQMLEEELGKVAETTLLPMQSGDVPTTHADVSELQNILGFSPSTTLQEGIKNFVSWFLDFYSEY